MSTDRASIRSANGTMFRSCTALHKPLVFNNKLVFVSKSPAFQLDLSAQRQSVGAKRGTSRQMIRCEIRNVDFVERTPFSHIRDHDGAFENVIETQIIPPQDSADIFQG